MANMYDTEKNRRSTCCAMSCCAMSVCALVALVVIGLDFAIFLRSPWIELTVGAATTVGTTTPTETATSSGTHTPTNAAEAMVARSVQPTSAVSSAVLTPRSQTPGNTTKFEFWFIGTSIGDRVWGELGYFPVVSSKDLKDNLALDDQKVKDLQDQISFDVSPWVHGINGVPPSLISSFILLVAQQVLTITIISRKWSRIAPSFPCAPIPKTTGTQRSRSRKDCWGCRDGCRDCCSQCPVVFVLEILVLAVSTTCGHDQESLLLIVIVGWTHRPHRLVFCEDKTRYAEDPR